MTNKYLSEEDIPGIPDLLDTICVSTRNLMYCMILFLMCGIYIIPYTTFEQYITDLTAVVYVWVIFTASMWVCMTLIVTMGFMMTSIFVRIISSTLDDGPFVLVIYIPIIAYIYMYGLECPNSVKLLLHQCYQYIL